MASTGIKHYAQIQMHVPPTEDEHVVRFKDLKDYVAGKVKSPCRAVSTSNIEGSYSGTPDFTLTSTGASLEIDGVSISVGDRILLAGQTDKKQNGVYDVTTLDGSNIVLTRSDDFSDAENIYDGVRVSIREGEENADTLWVMVTNDPITLDTTELEWVPYMNEAPTNSLQEKIFTITGDDSKTEWTFQHNIGTKNVTVEVFDNETGSTANFDVTRTDENNIKVSSAVAPSTGSTFTVLCRGFKA